MKKVFLYLDAENLSKEQILEHVDVIKAGVTEEEILIGKFYGSKETLHSIVRVCYSLGLDFIETSSISESTKNVADMKLTVDCLYDVIMDTNNVNSVYILTQDKDFLPLIYKLYGLGIRVFTPLLKFIDNIDDTVSIARYLHSVGFSPRYHSDILKEPVKYALSVAGENFSNEEIIQYFQNKRQKFVNTLSCFLEIDICAKILDIQIDEFGWNTIISCLPNLEFKLLCTVLDIYTGKFFGFKYGNSLENIVANLVKEI